ncbi:DUF433 domain-containing protein [Aurantimonas sp. A2-1-M11]|uniref:DUF433 domain-containing protein n=1 Tax=Aurantimonas sp. A2-1-M11 TaxID=3113712 RepID=UPI002F95CDE1
MPEIFFTADTHYGHRGIIEMCQRPFFDVEDMDEGLVRRWNDRVRKNDAVYHLGDFAMKSTAERCTEIFGRLNGRKHLIIGNHDRLKVRNLPWASQPQDRILLRHPDEKLPLVLDHYALRTWPGVHYGAIHLYGHSHGNLQGIGRSVDVGVDVWDFQPVTLDEIRPTLELQQEEFERQQAAHRMMRERAARGDPAKALEILERLPDVDPEPGDEVVPYAGAASVDEQAEGFARLWRENRAASEAGVGYRSRVVEDPNVMSGEPCVEGTRVPARTVLAYLKAGRSDVEIFEDYPTLPVDGIAAVRRWASELGFGMPEDGEVSRGT